MEATHVGYPAAVLRENEGTYTNVRVPGGGPSSERRAEKTDEKTDSKAAVPALRRHGDGGAPCHLNVPGALCALRRLRPVLCVSGVEERAVGSLPPRRHADDVGVSRRHHSASAFDSAHPARWGAPPAPRARAVPSARSQVASLSVATRKKARCFARAAAAPAAAAVWSTARARVAILIGPAAGTAGRGRPPPSKAAHNALTRRAGRIRRHAPRAGGSDGAAPPAVGCGPALCF